MQVSTKLHIPKDEILKKLRNYVTDVQQHVPCAPLLMDEWDSAVPLNAYPFHPRGKLLYYNAHECYVNTWGLMAGKRLKLQYKLNSNYKHSSNDNPCIIHFFMNSQVAT